MNRKPNRLFLVPVLVLLATGGWADEIHWKSKNRKPYLNVEVIRVTFSEVKFKFLDPKLRDAGAQSEPLSNMKEIVFTFKPGSYMRGEKMEREGKMALAVESYRRAIKDRDAAGWVAQHSRYAIARCCLAMGKNKQALAALQELLEKEPDTRFYGEAHTQIARIQMSLGKSTEATRALDALIKKAEQGKLSTEWGYRARLEKARFQEVQGKLDPALRDYSRLASDTVGSHETLSRLANLGRARCLNLQGKSAKAKPLLNGLVEKAKKDETRVLAGAYNGLGTFHLAQGDWKEALLSYLRVVTLYPEEREEMPEALFQAARCFYILGEKESNVEWKRRAAALMNRLKSEFVGSKYARMNYKK